MKRDQLLKELRYEAKSAGLEFRVDKAAGKGSHYRVYVGSRFTTVQSGELTPFLIRRIRRQLGLE